MKAAANAVKESYPLPEQAIHSCQSINQELLKTKARINAANAKFPDEVKDIRPLLESIRSAFSIFVSDYNIEL